MPSGFVFDMDERGIGELLKSDPVRADLEARAQRVAAAAGPGMVADSQVGATRARAGVITATIEARLAEATRKALTSALSRGGG